MIAYNEREAVLKAARSLAPVLSARAEEGERLRTMPADLVERVKAAHLFGLGLPRSLGGLELDPATQVQVIEELSRADGSAGWTVMIGNSTTFFAWLDPDVARGLIAGDTHFASTSMLVPLGRAVPDGGEAFIVDGRWPFNSGCPHAEWFQTGVFVMDGDGPRMVPGRGPDWRFAFFPRHAAKILDTWDAAGLRGTGSHDVAVTGLRVPEEHLAAPLFEPARHDGPLWRIPFRTMIGIHIVGFPLGVARRALDDVTELATTKRRGAAANMVAHDEHAQIELARAEAGVQAARAFVFDAIGHLWTTACGGDPPSLDQRARLLLAVLQAMRASVAAIDAVFTLAGAGAVYTGHPLQRCLRDIHTANQHIYFSADAWKRYAKLRFGIDQSTFLI
jgi:alkylation response protein AidB-like acyl-CoA dehydrogenase